MVGKTDILGNDRPINTPGSVNISQVPRGDLPEEESRFLTQQGSSTTNSSYPDQSLAVAGLMSSMNDKILEDYDKAMEPVKKETEEQIKEAKYNVSQREKLQGEAQDYQFQRANELKKYADEYALKKQEMEKQLFEKSNEISQMQEVPFRLIMNNRGALFSMMTAKAIARGMGADETAQQIENSFMNILDKDLRSQQRNIANAKDSLSMQQQLVRTMFPHDPAELALRTSDLYMKAFTDSIDNMDKIVKDQNQLNTLRAVKSRFELAREEVKQKLNEQLQKNMLEMYKKNIEANKEKAKLANTPKPWEKRSNQEDIQVAKFMDFSDNVENWAKILKEDKPNLLITKAFSALKLKDDRTANFLKTLFIDNADVLGANPSDNDYVRVKSYIQGETFNDVSIITTHMKNVIKKANNRLESMKYKISPQEKTKLKKSLAIAMMTINKLGPMDEESTSKPLTKKK